MGETELFTNNGANNGKKLRHSTLSTARTIVEGQGIKGLFVGLTPRVLKIAPACAIMISSYEFFKRFFRRWNESHAQNSAKD